MNTAARVAVRLGIDRGHTILTARNGFKGLRDGGMEAANWMTVTEWTARGGAELGTSRYLPEGDALETIAGQMAAQRIDALLMIGGWTGYWAAHALHVARHDLPAFNIPIVCLPASINNDLPGSELSIGADTALNSIVADVDKIKQSAVASGRTFVIEVMGHDCGYLALMSGLATGAERVYLPEEGIDLDHLQADVHGLTEDFRRGKRLGLVIRSERADHLYTTAFIQAVFQKEGGGLFEVRQTVLGHVQQGGDPSPFDRIQATRLVARALEFLDDQAGRPAPGSAMMGVQEGHVRFTPLGRLPDLVDAGAQRPANQPWLALRSLAAVMARPTQG
jgi:6-phosphofructokinase 1